MRAALLLRMGEGEAARALVQDVDTGNYTPDLTKAAFDSYIATADITGVCPAVSIQGGTLSGPEWGKWNATNGEKGKTPAPWMIKVMEDYKRAFTLRQQDRIPVVKEMWALLVDNVHAIGTAGLSPAFMGVRVVKNTMGNVPARQYNSPDVRTPSVSKVMTVYFKA